MKIQLNFNEVRAKLSLPLRLVLALVIFLVAFFLRFSLWPAESGLSFITFYPAAFLAFYLCGMLPGIIVTLLSAASAFYMTFPPNWTFSNSNAQVVAVAFYIAGSWLMGYVLSKGYYWHSTLIRQEHDKLEALNKQLQMANDLLTLAERSASAGAWRWNTYSNNMKWSEELFKLFGLAPEKDEPSFASWRKVVHPEDLNNAEQLIRAAASNLEAFVIFYRIILPDGKIRWIDCYGGPIYDLHGHLIEFSGICINSTSLHLAEQQIQESEQRFRNMFTNLTVGYQALDINGNWLDANQKMADILGFASPEVMIGKHFSDSWTESEAQFDAFYNRFKQQDFAEGEFSLKRHDGQSITVIISGRIQRNKEGRFICAHSIIIDITERQKMEHKIMQMNAELEMKIAERTAELYNLNQELLHQSRHDALTGLHNRLSANERIHTEFIAMKRSQLSYAVLMLDIDYFKQVNDTFGHAVGDSVLQLLALLLRSTLRESDFAARYGGEEFLLLLPSTELYEARFVAEKIRHAVESSPHPAAGRFTVSIGVAIATHDDKDEYIAVKTADDHLYAAKNAGRNCIMAATPQ